MGKRLIRDGVFCLPAIALDHADVSPISLGYSLPTSFVQIYVVCTEVPTGPPALTLGDEDDADSHFTYAMLPTTLNETAVGPVYYYTAAKNLRATITGAGTAGKWSITPIIMTGV